MTHIHANRTVSARPVVRQTDTWNRLTERELEKGKTIEASPSKHCLTSTSPKRKVKCQKIVEKGSVSGEREVK